MDDGFRISVGTVVVIGVRFKVVGEVEIGNDGEHWLEVGGEVGYMYSRSAIKYVKGVLYVMINDRIYWGIDRVVVAGVCIYIYGELNVSKV